MINGVGLTYQVDDKVIVQSTDFRLKPNQIIGLVGKSGAGKTTLLKMLAGHLTPSSGSVAIDGAMQPNANTLLIPGFHSIAYVSQTFDFDQYRTASEVLRLAMTDLIETEKTKMIAELLALVDLSEQRDQQVKTLSGGEKQRLGVLYALALERPFLFLDEPFVHLDNRMRRNVIDYLIQLKNIRGLGVLIVSHQAEEILGVCDKVIYLKNGIVKRKATPKKFYSAPKSVEEAELFGPINTIKLAGKRRMFRPNAYDLHSGNHKVEVAHQSSEFQGAYWLNNFTVSQQQKAIILFSLEPMTDIKAIYID